MDTIFNWLRTAFLVVAYLVFGAPISVIFSDWDNSLCPSEKLFEVATLKTARYLGIEFSLDELPESVPGSAAGHPEFATIFSEKFFALTGNTIPPSQIAQIHQMIWLDLAKKDPMVKSAKRFFRVCRLFRVKIVVCSNNHTYICRLWSQLLYPEHQDLFIHFYGKTRLRVFSQGKAYYSAMIAYPPTRTGVAIEDSLTGLTLAREANLRTFFVPVSGSLPTGLELTERERFGESLDQFPWFDESFTKSLWGYIVRDLFPWLEL